MRQRIVDREGEYWPRASIAPAAEDRFGPDHEKTIEEVLRLRRKYGETLTYAQVRDEMLDALWK